MNGDKRQVIGAGDDERTKPEDREPLARKLGDNEIADEVVAFDRRKPGGVYRVRKRLIFPMG